MGMLFNSEATLEMIATVNDEFSKAKKKNKWKQHYGDFTGAMSLGGIANKHGVQPNKGGAKSRLRWQFWLDKVLHATPSDDLPYPNGANGPYPHPPKSPTSNVGEQLKKLLASGIGDDSCAEIVMVIQPDTKVYLTQAQRIPLIDPAGQYALVITLCTSEIPPNAEA